MACRFVQSVVRRMDKVLIVEDSKVFARILIRKIEDELFFDTCWASNFEEARYLLDENPDDNSFFVALLDLHLPDAPDGSIVDYVIAKGIPSIVFTGDVEDEVRDRIWAKKVVDYVSKESPDSLDYLCALIRRIALNKDVPILVVDDSTTVRHHLARLLTAHEYIVHGGDLPGQGLLGGPQVGPFDGFDLQGGDGVLGQKREVAQIVDDVAVVGVDPILVEGIGRGEPRIEIDGPLFALAELGAGGGGDKRKGQAEGAGGLVSGRALLAPDQLQSGGDVAELVAAADLQGAAPGLVQIIEVVGLEHHGRPGPFPFYGRRPPCGLRRECDQPGIWPR